MVVRFILVIIFLLFSAFFSGSEIVYAKVNKNKLEREIHEGKKGRAKALSVANSYDKTLSTILIGNNLVNIAMTSVAGIIASELVKDMPEYKLTIYTTLVITVVVLIFGEILPKTIFQSYSYTLSICFAPFINFLTKVFTPVIKVVKFLVDKMSKIFVKEDDLDDEEEPTGIDDELNELTDELTENGSIDEDDAELIKSAIDFIDTKAMEIMTPRVDVIAYDIEDSFENIIKDEDFYKKSRVPLYKETIDNIIGIISTTKVLKSVLNRQSIELNDCLVEPLYVHKTMDITDVLRKLKDAHTHVAVVLDEWGGMMGILTIEDILEELFGDIWDETDEVAPEYEEIDEHNFLIDGDMNIYDLFDLVEYDDREFESDYTTVGGFATEVLEKFPDENDQFDFENLTFKIVSVETHRVGKVLVTINPKDEEDED